jgi:hypothetical protein
VRPRLQQIGKRPQFGRRRDQAVARQSFEILIRCAGRIFQPAANLLNAPAKQALREVQMIAQKLIGMLRIDPERRKRRVGKVFQIGCDDDIATADNGGSENMPVVFVWK